MNDEPEWKEEWDASFGKSILKKGAHGLKLERWPRNGRFQWVVTLGHCAFASENLEAAERKMASPEFVGWAKELEMKKNG